MKRINFIYIMSIVLTALTMVMPNVATAVSEDACLTEYVASPNCTAGEGGIKSMVVVGGTLVDNCAANGTATAAFDVEVQEPNADRYDIGIFIARDGLLVFEKGGSDFSSDCYHDYIPVGDPAYVNINDNSCGDVKSKTTVVKRTELITFQCVDNNSNGDVDVSVCTTYSQDSSAVCTDVTGAIPGTRSKCGCVTKDVGITTDTYCGDGETQTPNDAGTGGPNDDGNEDCDNGDANSDSLPDACRTDCVDPGCGDFVTDTSEDCDDGPSGSETCTDNCTTITPRGTYCGDSIVQSPNELGTGGPNDDGYEDCDDGNDVNIDNCVANCTDAVCGDGYLWVGNEECDDGDGNSDVLPDSCRTNCDEPYCGDGVTDTIEECDGQPFCTDSCEWEKPYIAAPSIVPTMNEWGMIIFLLLAGLGSLYYMRRQNNQG